MTLIYAVLLLGILIFVHEFGHFIFAKLLGVKVLRFSLGFGPKLIGRTVGDTEYRLSAVPLGGYVKMLGEEPGEELQESEKARAYNFQPVFKRFVIVLAGPFFNIVFACLLFVLLFLTGVPALYPDIGRVVKNSPAERAGLMMGDRVVSANGKTVGSWDELSSYLEERDGGLVTLQVKRGRDILEIPVKPEEKSEETLFGEKKEFWEIGVSPLVFPVVGEVMKGTPAATAGLLKGDRIIAINGSPVQTWEDMTDVIHNSPARPLQFEIRRGDQVFAREITPAQQTMRTAQGEEKKIGLIGVRPLQNEFTKTFGIADSLSLGVKRTWDVSVLTVMSIVKLIQRVIPADTIGGPILIFQMAGQEAAHGPVSFFVFMAVISINLGVLNILPIPILDGGHMMFLLIETIRKKPLSETAIMMAQRIGLALLVTLMVFALYNDILRLVTGKMLP